MNFSDSLALALLLGAAFGACLEVAGMGNANKLAGQFTLRDFTVFKVMFSAIVSAMLGTFWLGRAGVIALDALYVPDTFLLPQLLGGLVFGVGFAVSGLCPGTACVAAASGKIDGLCAMGGVVAGMLLAGLAMPALTEWYRANALGATTLPAALGMPYGVVVAAVVAMAVALFAIIERRKHAS